MCRSCLPLPPEPEGLTRSSRGQARLGEPRPRTAPPMARSPERATRFLAILYHHTMKPHPRIRRTIKWGGAAMTVLLVVVWIGSGWWFASLRCLAGFYLEVGAGTVQVTHIDGEPQGPNYQIGRYAGPGFRRAWWFQDVRAPYFHAIVIPIWVVLAVVLPAASIAWRFDAVATRRDRARRLGLCLRCNYERIGLSPGSPCPECGSTPE
jgi:hypothetical protein